MTGRRTTIGIGPAFGQQMALVREGLGMSQSQLAARSGVSARTISGHESGERFGIEEETLRVLAEALEVPYSTLLKTAKDSAIVLDEILSLCESVDAKLMTVVRQMEQLSHERLKADPYSGALLALRNITRMGTRDTLGIEPDSLLGLLSTPRFVDGLLADMPEPDIVVAVEPDRRALSFIFDGRSHVIENPQLLWDCSCAQRPERSGECQIHQYEHADELARRFGAGLVDIHWGNLKFHWRNAREIWPPSVDSLWFADTLRKRRASFRSVRSVQDMGAGTGFLGLAAASVLPNVKRVLLADWLLAPIVYSLLNARRNASVLGGVSVKGALCLSGRLVNWEGEAPSSGTPAADLTLVNPPYLPVVPGCEGLRIYHTVAGTELLEQVIHRAPAFGGEVLMQFSNVARTEARRAATEAGQRLRRLEGPLRVPFRVRHAFQTTGYVDVLLARGLTERRDHLHQYWHELNLYRIESGASQVPLEVPDE